MYHLDESNARRSRCVKADVGLIGLAVMGQNLVLNIARKGYSVAVYNRTAERTKKFVEERVKSEKVLPTYSIEDFVNSLSKPRKIILMVKAGQPVDDMINELLPHLEKGDLLIDGGNSHFADTDRRLNELAREGILYLGMGVSGGEYGALHGPSLMPGGTREAYNLVEEILMKIAAKTEDGPCCTYVGNGSAGHFVKMVHNGIEYSIMQSIAEIYDIMRKVMKFSSEKIGETFEEWNRGELSSFLMEISYKIMRWKDEETNKPLVEMILDKAEQKGTGKWSTQVALDLGVPVFSFGTSVFARAVSYYKEERQKLAKLYKPEVKIFEDISSEDLQKALSLAYFLSYSQGIWLIHEASKSFNYGVDLLEVLRIWKGGCIIRSKMLDFLRQLLKSSPENFTFLNDERALDFVKERLPHAIKVANLARSSMISTPSLNGCLDYLFSLMTENLPANLIQAQRDFFGAHTFQRIDRPGTFHIEWQPLE